VDDPITISDESKGDPRSSGGRSVDEKVEAPQTEGWTPWPIGLHSVEEEREKKNEEEQRKRREEEKKKEEEEGEQRRLLEQQQQEA
jgi:hypothetical protein